MATGYYSVDTEVLQSATSPSGTSGSDSGWVFTGELMSVSVQVENLESGGSVTFYTLNFPQFKNVPPTSSETGSVLVDSRLTNGVLSSNGALANIGSFTYLRFKKTAGGSPTATKVTVHGQIPK